MKMMSFTRRALSALLLLPLALVAAAQAAEDTPQARRAAAEELVRTMDELTGPKRMMAGMQDMMRAPIQQGLTQNQQLSAAQQQRATEVLTAAMSEALGETMGSVMPMIYATMTQMYVERFSLAEIEQLRAFYASPVLRKATLLGIEEMPRLMQPMMQSMQQMAPRMKQRMDAATEQLKREGIDLSPPKPAAAK